MQARDTAHVSDIHPFPRQLDNDQLIAQFHALRAVADPTLVELIDLRSTIHEIIHRDSTINEREVDS